MKFRDLFEMVCRTTRYEEILRKECQRKKSLKSSYNKDSMLYLI